MMRPKPLVLIILDGWGISTETEANAIAEAAPPFYLSLLERYPHTTLEASGLAVGLPEGQMGNSEVGHINIGGGRIVYQELTRITRAISEGSFFQNKTLLEAVEAAIREESTLHLLGLLSNGGVHSHIDHLAAILEMAKQKGLFRLRVHPFLDGRDVPPQSALGYIKDLEAMLCSKCPEGGDWKIATVSGRYYAMDRDKRWNRVEKAFSAIVSGEGNRSASAASAIQKSYEIGLSDEFILPTVLCEEDLPLGLIQDRDAVLFFNFRADRARQLTRALSEKEFTSFVRTDLPRLSSFASLTSYDETLQIPVAFEPSTLKKMLGEVLSKAGLRQLRIAETEKYAHVTYFFNGGREQPFEGEERILIPSPRDIATYDLRPEMSAPEVTAELVRQIKRDRFDFICVNFANPDMVGHSGILKAAVKAVKAIDHSLEKVVKAVIDAGGIAIITADHGNLEHMLDAQTGKPHTAHTTNPVPFILVTQEKLSLRSGIHANIAPTILELMQIPKPSEMEEDSLLLR